MDTTNNALEKQAQLRLRGLLGIPSDSYKSYLTLATALGILGGAGAGSLASTIKTKNEKIIALDRKKKFYEDKTKELKNDNWLDELISTKKKLESTNLTDDERTDLENKYRKLLNNDK